MAHISNFVLASHLRSEQSAWVVLSKDGLVSRKGRGLAFWFFALDSSVAEIPVDDRELPFLFHARSSDFQDVVTQGVITWRVVDPDKLAERVDFSIDLRSGAWQRQPVEQVASLLQETAQQVAWGWLATHDLAEGLRDGVVELRDRIGSALASHPVLAGMGLEVVSVRVASVRPAAEVEKALQTPAREAIQQEADKATYERRARAVERERAIAENELQNQIELARREEELIGQRGANERRRVALAAEAAKLTTEGEVERGALQAGAEAQRIRVVESARNEAEEARTAIWKDLPDAALVALVGRELAANLGNIEHLSITPELVGPALQRLARV